MTPIIYISSDPRAGSTFLQKLLGTHPHVAGLGEIANVISRAKFPPSPTAAELPCSCGAPHQECPFWGALLGDLSSCDPLEAQRKILARFAEIYPGRVMIDSSKSTAALAKHYLNSPDASQFDVRVLHVIRDFRGWVPSAQKQRRRIAGWTAEETPAYLTEIVAKLRRDQRGVKFGYLQDSYRWMMRARRELKTLAESGMPHLVVSYDELIFDSARQLARIGDFLGLNQEFRLDSLGESETHDLYGSPTMKKDSEKSAKIFYDHGWLRDTRSVYLAPFLLPVHAFNRQVYSELACSPPQNLKQPLTPFQADFRPSGEA